MSDDGAVEIDTAAGEPARERRARDVFAQRNAAPLPLPPEPPLRRSMVLAVSAMVSALLITSAVFIPLPFVIVGAGPTFDILDARSEDEPELRVVGTETYETSGELRITTVGVTSSQNRRIIMGNVFRGYLSDSDYVAPDVVLEPTGGEDSDAEARQSWITSQERAMVSALDFLDIEVDTIITVVDFQDSSNAVGVLQLDDVIVGANGRPVHTIGDLSDALDALTPGDPVTIRVARPDGEVDVVFDTIDDGDGSAVMGIWINPDFSAPFQVTVEGGDVGGPSAGMMFALAIIETLTPQDESGGAHVAGTGTISLDGDVGPIGGIALKMRGAVDDGADWFLAPVENCGEVVGHIPAGLTVVSVDNLEDAYAAVIAIGEGDTSALPTCS